MNKKILVSILLLLLSGVLWTKNVNLEIDYNGYYSDNIFMNATAVGDYVSQLHAGIHYDAKPFTLYLDSSTSIYADKPQFNSYRLEPGVQYFHLLKKRNGIYLDLSYNILDYNEYYTDFNYNGPRFQAYAKIYLTGQTLLKAGYRFEARNYRSYRSFDFYNHNTFVEVMHFFPTQTRIQLSLGYNYRYYPHVVQNFDFGENYRYYGPQSKGNMGGSMGGGGDGNGGGMGHGHTGIHPGQGNQPLRFGSTNVPNLYAGFNVSQAIGARMDISAEVELKHNFQGLENAEALIKNAYIIYPYNDGYLWNGYRLTIQLKSVIFTSISLVGRVSYLDKDYRGILIRADDGSVALPETQRKDSLLKASLKVSKKFDHLELFTNIAYSDNSSNDSFFHYKMTTITVGIGYSF